MYKLLSISSISSLLQGNVVSRSTLAFISGTSRTFKAVNRRTLGTIGATLMLSAFLTACGSSSSSSSSNDTSTSSGTLSVTTGIKTINFSWSAIPSATSYQLQSNPDGSSGFTDLSTTGIVVSPNSTNITGVTSAQASVALHRYIPAVTNPQYIVRTCTTTSSCVNSHNTVSLTNAQLNGMIGRLQASNAEANDLFGWYVSLSGDGNTLAVSANLEDSTATGINGAQDDNNSTAAGAVNSSATGAVYVFSRIGGAWSQQAYIKASNTGSDDRFGQSVSLSADGNTLAVGADREDGSSTGVNGAQNDSTATSGSGAVYVFSRTGGVWSQQAYIKASNTGAGDRFGQSVSLSADGNTLAVSANREDGSSTGVNGVQDSTASGSGAVYLFRFSSSTWAQQAYIKASNTDSNDQFGESVSLSADGNTLAVGANREDGVSTGVNGVQDSTASSDSGAVYLFRFSSSTWAQQAYIKASNTERGDEFGYIVSLNADGNTLAVGARRESSLSTGVNVALSDSTATTATINSTTNVGAVYVFRFDTSSSTWSQQAYIKASNSGANDEFGYALSLSADGNILAVGAYLEDGSATGVGGADDNAASDSGATYVFEFANSAWAQKAYIKTTGSSAMSRSGNSVSLSSNGNSLAVGAAGEATFAGAVYLY